VTRIFLVSASLVSPPEQYHLQTAEPMFQASDSDLAPMFFEGPAPAPTQEELETELARLVELRAILEGVN
jgi:hypothetical protein